MTALRSSALPRLLAAAALGVLTLTACGAEPPSSPTAAGGPVPVVPEMGHVHGLGVNPGDGDVYVATHTGVFRVPDDASPARVADRYQDTMGFTIVGPDEFLASGHPDLQERDLPTHLGLIASDDAAETWDLRSLAGEADFHALDAGPAQLFGYDALSGRLLGSPDGEKWSVLDTGPVLDIAAAPTAGDGVLASDPSGRLVLHQDADQATPLSDAPALGPIDWPAPELLVGADAAGQLHRSTDGGRTWTAVGSAPGPVQSLDVSEDAWLVATEAAVLRSTDEGRTWQALVAFR